MEEPTEDIEEDFIKRAQKQVEEMTPEKGFNLCGLDDMGSPLEQGLFLIGNFATIEEANVALGERQAESPGEVFYVYGPEEKKTSPVRDFMAGQSEE